MLQYKQKQGEEMNYHKAIWAYWEGRGKIKINFIRVIVERVNDKKFREEK